jgi:hypothetical protein
VQQNWRASQGVPTDGSVLTELSAKPYDDTPAQSAPELPGPKHRYYFVVESPMTATPRALLDTSIAQLQTLTAFLGDRLTANAHRTGSRTTPEIRACEEILVSLGALILKVQAARGVRSRG